MDKRAIAEAYLEHPTWYFGSSLDRDVIAERSPTIKAYRALAQESTYLAAIIRQRIRVTEISVADPYTTAAEMFHAIGAKHFAISDLFCDHPLWTPEENIAFRITHDVHGHWDGQAPFSWAGELAAYYSQCKVHSKLAQRALFTEIVGQTACFSLTGEFPEQKAILLPAELDV